jgi:hypothetical protein
MLVYQWVQIDQEKYANSTTELVKEHLVGAGLLVRLDSRKADARARLAGPHLVARVATSSFWKRSYHIVGCWSRSSIMVS